MASTNRAMDGRVSGTGRRFRLASPVVATVLGLVLLLSIGAMFALEILIHQFPTSSSNVASSGSGVAFVLAFTAVGVVVARREPRNPMGWLLIAVALAVQVGSVGPAYAYLDYSLHHGTLPLGHVALLGFGAWEYVILLVPLVILFFPDGRLGPRWRWPVRVYLMLGVVFVAGTLSVPVAAFGLRSPLDDQGNFVGVNPGWVGPVQSPGIAACVLLLIASVVYQGRKYLRASGERRQQLKCAGAGVGVLVICAVVNAVSGGGSGFVGEASFAIGLAALPVGIGVGILKYRLYEIDRLISRGLSYAILTGLLVGTFIGLIALTTNTLALSGRVGVAASTLAAAALFNPLRKRIQHLVDRRFNRARYDAEATVAAFTSRLRDAVEIDAIGADLLDAVNRAVQPTQASVWIKPHARG